MVAMKIGEVLYDNESSQVETDTNMANISASRVLPSKHENRHVELCSSENMHYVQLCKMVMENGYPNAFH